MKKILICISTLLTTLCTQLYAANFVCPNTYQTIGTGFTQQQVESACGKPESIQTHMSTQSKPINYTQWVYTIGKTNNLNQFSPQMNVYLYKDKVTQITVSNQNLTNNFPCYSNGRIQVGSTTAQVQLQCGPPSYVNQIQKGTDSPIKIVVLTYNFGSYKPKMIFTFTDNKLTDIKTGPLAK